MKTNPENELIKRIEAWFPELEITDFNRKRITSLLLEYKREHREVIEVVSKVTEIREIRQDISYSDIDQIAKMVCERRNITMMQLTVNNRERDYLPFKQRSQELICSRRHFVRAVLSKYPYAHYTIIGMYLGYKKNNWHTSVINLLRGKTPVIESNSRKFRKITKVYENMQEMPKEATA